MNVYNTEFKILIMKREFAHKIFKTLFPDRKLKHLGYNLPMELIKSLFNIDLLETYSSDRIGLMPK